MKTSEKDRLSEEVKSSTDKMPDQETNSSKVTEKSRDRLSMSTKTILVINALKVTSGTFKAWSILDDQLVLVLGLWQVQVMLVAPILLFLPKCCRTVKEAIDVWTQSK